MQEQNDLQKHIQTLYDAGETFPAYLKVQLSHGQALHRNGVSIETPIFNKLIIVFPDAVFPPATSYLVFSSWHPSPPSTRCLPRTLHP